MSWNHRILYRRFENEEIYTIHEVYYEDGEPHDWTTDPVQPQGETLKELKQEIERFQKAFKKPVLIEKNEKLIPYKP